MELISKVLWNFLNLYWIRPETAIWRTLDVLQMRNLNFKKPVLDASCGDGSFTFTHFLGKLIFPLMYTELLRTQNNFLMEGIFITKLQPSNHV